MHHGAGERPSYFGVGLRAAAVPVRPRRHRPLCPSLRRGDEPSIAPSQRQNECALAAPTDPQAVDRHHRPIASPSRLRSDRVRITSDTRRPLKPDRCDGWLRRPAVETGNAFERDPGHEHPDSDFRIETSTFAARIPLAAASVPKGLRKRLRRARLSLDACLEIELIAHASDACPSDPCRGPAFSTGAVSC
jgi:hypothetical protein